MPIQDEEVLVLTLSMGKIMWFSVFVVSQADRLLAAASLIDTTNKTE